MSNKVISLAARRRKRLGLTSWGMHGKPVNRPAYDAWLEADGSLVLRLDPSAVELNKAGGSFTDAETGKPTFTLRDEGHEIRIAADVAEQWFKDMTSLGIASRKIVETRRGVYEWRFEPIGDGTFRARHAHRAAIFEPFKPKLRERYVGTGEKRKVAPTCEVCRRVIQIGETAFRERRNPSGRAWADAVICSGCIAQAPQAGLREATS